MSKKILLSAGGTGGHFFPAVAFYEYLKEQGQEVIFVTDHRCKSYIPEGLESNIKIVDVSRASKTPIGILRFLFSLLKAVFLNLCLLKKGKIDIIYSFGGYTSIASLIAAIICRKKIILSEQNIIPGRTNLIFARFAAKIAFGFADFSHVPDKLHNKLVHVGIPVRKLNAQIEKKSEFKITVLGGSQGAHIFSEILPVILASLPTSLRQKIELIQQARSEDINMLKEQYQKISFKAEIAEFFSNMNAHIATSDLVIARAGASTIAELIAYNKSAILIPYRYAKDNHQLYNAQYLEKLGLAKIVVEDNLDAQKIALIVQDKLAENKSAATKNLNDQICQHLLSLA